MDIKKIIESAKRDGRRILNEYESKIILKEYSIPIVDDILVKDEIQLLDAIDKLSFPLTLKGQMDDLTHKSEEGLVKLDIRSIEEAKDAFEEIISRVGSAGAVLVERYIKSPREFMAGMIRDPQFGPTVMFGLGGIFTEIFKDISFRVAPLKLKDAMEMMDDIKASKMLGSVRGLPEADKNSLSQILINLGELGMKIPEIKEIDINPILLDGSRPIGVDALIILEGD
ncbi:MAG TPA: carboxylate--amine ligase [Desulfobacteraceae bacterium]|nr:carboxylate--amine ligase [Desulfobacteraceae bacterium]